MTAVPCCFLFLLFRRHACTSLFPEGQLVTCTSLPRLQIVHWNKSILTLAPQGYPRARRTQLSYLPSYPHKTGEFCSSKTSTCFPLWCLLDFLPSDEPSLYHCICTIPSFRVHLKCCIYQTAFPGQWTLFLLHFKQTPIASHLWSYSTLPPTSSFSFWFIAP